jgi:hypothetical protein
MMQSLDMFRYVYKAKKKVHDTHRDTRDRYLI